MILQPALRCSRFSPVAALLACSAPAVAADTLIASGESVDFGGAVAGGSAQSLDWLHQNANHELIGLGTSHEEFAGAELNIARLMGALNVGPGSTLTANAEMGPVNEGLIHYTFMRISASATHTLSPALQLIVGTQYVEADPAHTLLVHGGAMWLPLTSLSVHTEVGESVSGNLPMRFATVRTDYVRRVQIYVGASVGKGAQSVVELNSVSYQHFWDGFVGAAVPMSACTIALSWDRLQLQSVVRRSLTLTLTVPLGRGT